MREPQTDREWREAATLAEVLLDLDSARAYGLISGGPPVDVDRCVDLLKRARAHGVVTRAADVNVVTQALVGELRKAKARATARRRRGKELR